MKKNELTDLKAKTEDELNRMLIDLRSEVSKISQDKVLGKLKDTNAIRNKQKDIARVLTMLTIKERMNNG